MQDYNYICVILENRRKKFPILYNHNNHTRMLSHPKSINHAGSTARRESKRILDS
jgi:hypothetical protein